MILYSKNIHERLYPASTTKIMTCLLAMEKGNLDDMVEFSHDAVFSVPTDGSKMGMDAGEAANAAGEYISGSIEDFVALMNERAEEMGCKDTHFMNPNGLHDPQHYTSAYDLAVISSHFYKKNKHRLINGEIPYDGILGGKTGYTDDSRQTLVTCAEQNGMRLVCVVLKEESPDQFTDTVELFDYGFHNFQVLNISENEEKYNIEATGFLQIGNDVFGSSKPILSIDTDSYVIIPNTVSFQDLDSEIDYSQSDENRVAGIEYSYNGMYVGDAYLNLVTDNATSYEYDGHGYQCGKNRGKNRFLSGHYLYQYKEGIDNRLGSRRRYHYHIYGACPDYQRQDSQAKRQPCQTQTEPPLTDTF